MHTFILPDSPCYLTQIPASAYLQQTENTVTDKDKTVLTACPAAARRLHIPAETKYLDRNKKQFAEQYGENGYGNYLTILRTLSCLEKITVHRGNTVFAEYDGMLFSKDLTTLLFCPPNKQPVSFPEEMTVIGHYAFCGNQKIRHLHLPKHVQYLTGHGDMAWTEEQNTDKFETEPFDKHVTIAKRNPYLAIEDDVIYSRMVSKAGRNAGAEMTIKNTERKAAA